jgi:hypothetical protein
MIAEGDDQGGGEEGGEPFPKKQRVSSAADKRERREKLCGLIIILGDLYSVIA